MKAIANNGYKSVTTPVRKYYKYQDVAWTQPILTWNGFMGYDDFAVASTSNGNGTQPWHLFADTMQTYGWTSANTAYPHTYTIFSKIPLNITNIQVTNYSTVGYFPKNWVIYGSNDNSNWAELNSGENTNNTANATWNIATNTNSYYNYYKIEFTNHLSGSGYTIRIGLFTLTATQKVAVESTSSDYDFYKDITEYKAVA